MKNSEITPVLERQLLLQLGDRLKRLRRMQKIGTVEMAAKAGISRNTLRSIEAGDPSPSMGSYLRVMSLLGVSGEIALLAGDTIQPAPPGSAAARSKRAAPTVRVLVTVDEKRHRVQDLQSLALHTEAVKQVKQNPALVQKAMETTRRWLEKSDSRSATLWHEWERIISLQAWRKVLGHTRHAQQLRQTSPLVTILTEQDRLKILKQLKMLKQGIEISDTQIPTETDIDSDPTRTGTSDPGQR